MLAALPPASWRAREDSNLRPSGPQLRHPRPVDNRSVPPRPSLSTRKPAGRRLRSVPFRGLRRNRQANRLASSYRRGGPGGTDAGELGNDPFQPPRAVHHAVADQSLKLRVLSGRRDDYGHVEEAEGEVTSVAPLALPPLNKREQAAAG